ncbi:hypothetical protein PENSPDRAFT_457106 [Peniophora sp. CONT]|nr:hypothetical protein PENSPDRAFT_457106 [Peniophora sp. CONT]
MEMRACNLSNRDLAAFANSGTVRPGMPGPARGALVNTPSSRTPISLPSGVTSRLNTDSTLLACMFLAHVHAVQPHVRLASAQRLASALLLSQRVRRGAARSSSSNSAVPPPSSRSVQAQRTYRPHYTGRSCSCGTHLSSKWYRDSENGGPLCGICYNRRKLKEENSGTTSCLDCGAKTSSRWYTHPSTRARTTRRCSHCYIQAQRTRHELLGQTCCDCGTTKSFRWVADPNHEGSFRCACQVCYLREHFKKAVFPNRSCVTCGVQKTIRWHKHSSSIDAFQCKVCWHREYQRRARSQAKKAVKKDQAKNLPEAGKTNATGSKPL